MSGCVKFSSGRLSLSSAAGAGDVFRFLCFGGGGASPRRLSSIITVFLRPDWVVLVSFLWETSYCASGSSSRRAYLRADRLDFVEPGAIWKMRNELKYRSKVGVPKTSIEVYQSSGGSLMYIAWSNKNSWHAAHLPEGIHHGATHVHIYINCNGHTNLPSAHHVFRTTQINFQRRREGPHSTFPKSLLGRRNICRQKRHCDSPYLAFDYFKMGICIATG